MIIMAIDYVVLGLPSLMRDTLSVFKEYLVCDKRPSQAN